MNGRQIQPPDKYESNGFLFNHNPTRDDLILNENNIKQEPMVKKEPNDTIENIVSISYAHVSTEPPSNPIDGVQMTRPYDFNDLIDIKSVIKAEEVTEKVGKLPETSSGKNETGSKQTTKTTFSGKESESKSSCCGRKKSTAKKRQSNGKKKQFKANPDKKQHQCSSCEYTTKYESHLKRHIFKHTGEMPFPCTHCSKRFSRKDLLQLHMRTHFGEFLFSCSKCLKGFSQINEKFEHEASCNVPRYECDLCKNYSTLNKTHLKTHMRVHTGERPFRCDQCLKKFKLQSHLKGHMKTHTNPRPSTFKCSICFRSFPQQAEKDKHEENCKKRGYECYLCKCFNSPKKSNLGNHMRAQHTSDKPFQCEICAKCFSHKGNFNVHKKIHK